ncbi:MAG TPA: hypothetical protein VI548_05625 [Chitinophagaceae bacterium]|nr:hypothetical protein [Chitinophagaceae bacterium]
MNTNKFLIGGIIGGIANFLLGWLVWGMLLMNFLKENMGTATGVMKAENEMVWWALIVGNLFWGFVLSYVLNKSGTSGVGGGATTGAMLGFLIAGGFDFTMLGTANIMTLNGVLVDIVASIVVSAIVGGVIGWYLGMGKKAA